MTELEYAIHSALLAVFVDGHVDWIRDVDARGFRKLVSI